MYLLLLYKFFLFKTQIIMLVSSYTFSHLSQTAVPREIQSTNINKTGKGLDQHLRTLCSDSKALRAAPLPCLVAPAASLLQPPSCVPSQDFSSGTQQQVRASASLKVCALHGKVATVQLRFRRTLFSGTCHSQLYIKTRGEAQHVTDMSKPKGKC